MKLGCMQENICVDILIDKCLKLYNLEYNDVENRVHEETIDKIVQRVNDVLSIPIVSSNDVKERQYKIKNYQSILTHLLCKPKVEQRTKEWFDLRANMITASDLGQSLGEGKFGSVAQVIKKKCGYEEESAFSHYIPPLKWGCMFEPIATDIYSKRMKTRVHEFGIIQHPSISHFGASPDGITDEGIMLEIKCPYKRKITGEIPQQYYYQIQGQLEVCDLDECDYLECGFSKYEDENMFYKDDSYPYEQGIIIEYSKQNEDNPKPYYLYSDILCYDEEGNYLISGKRMKNRDRLRDWEKEKKEGLLKDATVNKEAGIFIHYWKLEIFNTIRVYKDKDFITQKLEDLSKVWEKIQRYKMDKDLYVQEMCAKKQRINKVAKLEIEREKEKEKEIGKGRDIYIFQSDSD